MKTIYGPVPSRRHGRSIGINLGSRTTKICTWGCLYCQCGTGETREFLDSDDEVQLDKMLIELEERVKTSGVIDSVTFAGNSEPTAHPRFAAIAAEVVSLRKKLSGSWIVNCLTNGSELDRKEVREGLAVLDEAWIKLDCGSDDLFRKFNQPLERVGGVEDHLKRINLLESVKIQSMFWDCVDQSGLSNTTDQNFDDLLECYRKIKPKEIHITTLSRKPATRMLKASDPRRLLEFSQTLRKEGFKVKVFA